MATAVPMVETYRALRRLEIGGGKFREFGDLVPEAEDWTHTTRAVYLRSGFIERAYVPETEYDAFTAVQGLPEMPEPEVADDAIVITDPVNPSETPEDDGKDDDTEGEDTPEVSENPDVVENITEEDIEDLGDPEPLSEEPKTPARKIVRKKG